jgi:hypothetical protein
MGAKTVSTYSLGLVTSAGGVASDVINYGFNASYRRLVRVIVDYDPTGGASSVTTITDGDGKVVFTSVAGNTDIDAYISDVVVTKAQAAVTNGQVAPLVRGPLTVAVSAGGATKPVGVKLFLE